MKNSQAHYFAIGALVISVALNACSGQNGSSSALPPFSSDPSTSSSIPVASSSNNPGASSTTDAPTLTTQATTTGGIPSHIATWAYDQYWAQGQSATAAQVQKYITYAESGYGNAKPVADCGDTGICHSVFYLQTNQMFSSTLCPDGASAPIITASSESWYVHLTGYSDKLHRIHGTYTASCKAGSQSAPVWELNNSNTGVQGYFRNFLQKNADRWNYYFLDSTAGVIADQFYGPGGGFCNGSICSSTHEITTNTALATSHGSLVNSLNHTNGTAMWFFFNGFGYDGAQNANNFDLFQASVRLTGGVCENCVVNSNAFRTNMYAPVLNTMATVDNTASGKFVLLSTGTAAAGSSQQIAQRLLTTAIVWLGYKEGHTVVWPDLEYNTTNLAVWPEDLLYPSQPLESMSSGAGNIQVATNVWRREFAACYNNGAAIGQCAAVVNANSSAVVVKSTWFQKSYTHSVLLSGGDALKGGTVALKSLVFTANSTVVPAGGALLLVP